MDKLLDNNNSAAVANVILNNLDFLFLCSESHLFTILP